MMKWFDELYSWQKAQDLAIKVINTFSSIKDENFAKMTIEFGIWISNELAKWYENQFDMEFKLSVLEAKWICGKFRSMLHLAKKLEYIKIDSFDELYKMTGEVMWLMWWMVKSIKEKASKKATK